MTRRRHTPALVYTQGFFTALIRRHNWPPAFVSKIEDDSVTRLRKIAAAAGREAALKDGKGWNHGDMALPNTPIYGPPGMLKRAA